MPELSPERETKTITLPQSGGEVTIFENIKARDLDSLDAETIQEMTPTQMAALLIDSWNFTDPNGNDLDPNKENVGLLSLPDFTAIFEGAGLEDFLDEEGQQNES